MDLECAHCGDTAFTSVDHRFTEAHPDGAYYFQDGDGDACRTCGFPGHVVAYEDDVTWLSSDANNAVCTDPDCEDCPDIRKKFGLPDLEVTP